MIMLINSQFPILLFYFILNNNQIENPFNNPFY